MEETCHCLRAKVRATEEGKADAGGVDYLKTGGAAWLGKASGTLIKRSRALLMSKWANWNLTVSPRCRKKKNNHQSLHQVGRVARC